MALFHSNVPDMVCILIPYWMISRDPSNTTWNGKRVQNVAVSITLVVGMKRSGASRSSPTTVFGRCFSEITHGLLREYLFTSMVSDIFIISNDRPLGCPIICSDIYSQCYYVHLQKCFIKSSSLANRDAIFVDNC